MKPSDTLEVLSTVRAADGRLMTLSIGSNPADEYAAGYRAALTFAIAKCRSNLYWKPNTPPKAVLARLAAALEEKRDEGTKGKAK